MIAARERRVTETHNDVLPIYLFGFDDATEAALEAIAALPRCSDETAHNVRDATIKEIARYLDEEGHGIPAEKVRFMGPAVTRPHQPGEA